MATVEERLQALENKVWLAAGAAAVLVVWLGATNFYSIPKAALDAINTTAAKSTSDQIASLLDESQKNAARIKYLSTSDTLTLGGKCFKARHFLRCVKDEHMSTIYKDEAETKECVNAGYRVEQDVLVLAECTK